MPSARSQIDGSPIAARTRTHSCTCHPLARHLVLLFAPRAAEKRVERPPNFCRAHRARRARAFHRRRLQL
jgi:hypothetical protein